MYKNDIIEKSGLGRSYRIKMKENLMQKIFPVKNNKKQSLHSALKISQAMIANYPTTGWRCHMYRYGGFGGKNAGGMLIQIQR